MWRIGQMPEQKSSKQASERSEPLRVRVVDGDGTEIVQRMRVNPRTKISTFGKHLAKFSDRASVWALRTEAGDLLALNHSFREHGLEHGDCCLVATKTGTNALVSKTGARMRIVKIGINACNSKTGTNASVSKTGKTIANHSNNAREGLHVQVELMSGAIVIPSTRMNPRTKFCTFRRRVAHAMIDRGHNPFNSARILDPGYECVLLMHGAHNLASRAGVGATASLEALGLRGRVTLIVCAAPTVYRGL
jgi:hypothetical protein